jgi:hypothetical protein
LFLNNRWIGFRNHNRWPGGRPCPLVLAPRAPRISAFEWASGACIFTYLCIHIYTVHRFTPNLNTPKHIKKPPKNTSWMIKTTIWNQRTDEKNMHLWTFVLVLETRKVNWRVISRTITPSFSHIHVYISCRPKISLKKIGR